MAYTYSCSYCWEAGKAVKAIYPMCASVCVYGTHFDERIFEA